MAPINVGFSTVPGIMERASEADAVFWTRVRAELGRDDWEYFRTEDREPTLGWSKATQDTLRRPLRVVRADVPAEKAPEFSSLEVLDLSWTLYDHGVLLVEGRFRTRADVESATLRDHDF
jgi:hypothetical protein